MAAMNFVFISFRFGVKNLGGIMDWWFFIKPIFDRIKFLLDTEILLGILMISLAIQCLPETSLIKSIVVIRHDYQMLITFIIIVASGILIIRGAFNSYNYFKAKKTELTSKRAVIKSLYSLSEREKEILNECYKKDTVTIYRAATDAAANSLVEKKLFFHGSGHIMDLAFTMNDYVWDELKKNHRKILGH
jgi:hypothetical protein